ncbi:hypothetical protein SAY87_021379 [Trapa incisa]|uniref:CRM domain-containing protein n=1 Tax=Trapa incisa TaxID=236973 RepID=A0AAN7PR90_9MYRT|nr:hypothetical protein SAY87_021379 [Trapa incisa]
MIDEASKSKSIRLVKKIEHKLAMAQAKKLRAETLLSKVEASKIPASPDDDQEILTEEERIMFRKVGLRMKQYLHLGIRGVFDGVIENMHLHWKHRELAKALKRSIAMQRHESLSQHIAELEKTIQQMRNEIGDTSVSEFEDTWSSEELGPSNQATKFRENEYEDSLPLYEYDGGINSQDDVDWEDGEEFEFS